MISLGIVRRIARKRLSRATNEYLRALAKGPHLASRQNEAELLANLRQESGPHIHVGETLWAEPVLVPLKSHIQGHALYAGATGGGKTMAALPTVGAVLDLMPKCPEVGLGELDCKEDMFQRTLCLLAARLSKLDKRVQEALLERVYIIDFGQADALASYNLLARPQDADPDFFLSNRVELLRELWPSSDRLSLRGGIILRQVVSLLSEFSLPLTYVDLVLGSETLRQRLLARSRNTSVRSYFHQRFSQEGKQTVAALRARLDALLASRAVRLTLSGTTAPDFRRLMNDGYLVLINVAGPSVSRGVRSLLQSLVVQDI